MSHDVLLPFPVDDIKLALRAIDASSWSRLRGRRLFVTGGTGFVGKWLLATLLEARREFGLDCEAVVLSRDPQAFIRQAPYLARGDGVRLLRGDVVDFEFPEGEFDVVLHAATDVVASSTPRRIFETCVVGTQRVLDFAAAAQAHNVLLVSSGAVYGRQPPDMPRLSESFAGAPDPLSVRTAYGQGKRAAEWLAAAWAAEQGRRTVITRLFAFIGPGMPLDSHFAVGNFLRDALAGVPTIIQGDGTTRRSYLHAAEMAGWMWKIFFEGRDGEAYNVGGDEAVTIADLARRITSQLESPCGVDVRGQAVPGMAAERYVPDVSKARELGLDVALSLDQSILRTANWYRAAGLSS